MRISAGTLFGNTRILLVGLLHYRNELKRPETLHSLKANELPLSNEDHLFSDKFLMRYRRDIHRILLKLLLV